MTASHIFYIPVVALAGLVAGFIWGRAAALREVAARARLETEREAAREARRRERAAARAATAAASTTTARSEDDDAAKPD